MKLLLFFITNGVCLLKKLADKRSCEWSNSLRIYSKKKTFCLKCVVKLLALSVKSINERYNIIFAIYKNEHIIMFFQFAK